MSDVVYTQIADDLRSQILSGSLPAGSDAPTESELARKWHTSRGPVRNALAALRQEGLIETQRGRPARIVERRALQSVDVSIPFTRWATLIGATPGARTQEISLRRASSEVAVMLDIPLGTTVVEVLRLRLLDGRPAMLERLAYAEDIGRALFDIDTDAVSLTEYLASEGADFADIRHEIDAVAADEVDATLLAIPEGAPILRLRRVSRESNGRPIEASDDRYRGDLVRFGVATQTTAAPFDPTSQHYTRNLA